MVTIAGIVGYLLLLAAGEATADANAQLCVGHIVIEYMERNGGSWPHGWDDLQAAFEASQKKNGMYSINDRSYIDELRRRVVVDFSADSTILAKMPPGDEAHPPFHVIRLRSGRHFYYSNGEANTLIWEHLQKQARRPQAADNVP
jgi:hypothetical protein